MSTEPEYRSGFIALVGPANAGKSTLVNALTGVKVSITSPKPQTTRNRILGIVHRTGEEFIFVDSPGFVQEAVSPGLGRYLRTAIRNSTEGVDCLALVVDARRIVTEQDSWEALITGYAREIKRAPSVVVLNKVDLVEKLALLPMIAAGNEELHRHWPENVVKMVPVSALKRSGIKQLFQVFSRLLPVAPQCYPEEMIVEHGEEFVIAEIIREKMLYRLSQEVPHGTAVRVDEIQEDGSLLQVTATIFVERDSQKGIVIGKGGKMLKSIGTDARVELERRLKQKVFLQLHVKVESDWTRTEKGIQRVGFTLS